MSIDSKKEQLKGKVNEGVGKATGDDKKELKGKVQDAFGKVKEKADEAVDKVAEKLNNKD